MHVEKEKIRVTAILDHFRVVGYMHRFPGARLLDIVNMKEATFTAFTDVEIYSLADGKLIQKTSFLALNFKAIQFFYPIEDEHQEQAGLQ